ncbi:kinase-like domain-containing protein [Rhizophagus irregularis DAOM 181602=DAOM 197198]|uniref:Uncharacterized protein n=1 Tax=Rhizophagus irregularis (strain DAOM 197198w) TaxID=1432141 RepID=A0A015KTS2_RHIIW|nr:hypothetical protein RirG_082190 [Rhizophagus irregularis DAOM 197198w]GET51652.1 kinase-like domain-containing protein [Rhizophagus irregularis DAOM 181602=DAOM 197198]
MQLEINNSNDIIVEWITYNQFNYIKELGKDEFSTIYSAILKNGLLKYDTNKYEYTRKQNIKANCKYLHNSQSITNEFLNEVKFFDGKYLYGISQNPETKDYILILRNLYCNKCGKKFTKKTYKWCKSCQINDLEKNWTSGNEKIDNLVQEKQLNINGFNDIIVEWIPYNQFNNIKELEKDEFTMIYSAIWNDDRLFYNYVNYCDNKYIRRKNTKVILKLYNSQNTTTDEFLNEVNSTSNEHRIYGISQNPNTRDYIIVFPNKYYCEKCKRLTDISISINGANHVKKMLYQEKVL